MIFDLEKAIKVYGNPLKNLAYEVLRVVNRRGLHVGQDLITFFVITYAVDVNSKITFTDKLEKEKLENFVELCVAKMTDETSPLMKATKLNYVMSYTTFDIPETIKLNDILPEYLLLKTRTLLREIYSFDGTTNEELEKLFKKIAFHIFIQNRFGNTQNLANVCETILALRSVLKLEDLAEFTEMKKVQKLETLDELKNIICGIMMYNKYKENAGAEMRDIVDDVNQGYSRTLSRLSWVLHKLSTKSMDFARLVKKTFNLHNCKMTPYHPEREATYEYLKNVSQLYNQHEYYVSHLIRVLRKIGLDIDEYISTLYETYKSIYDVVQYRIAVPTDIVFPFFIKCSEIWQIFWDYLYLLVEINKFNDYIQSIALMPNHAEIISKIKSLTPKKVINESAELDEDTDRLNIDFAKTKCEWLMTYKLDLGVPQKFCTFFFISGNGWLIPSELHLGVIKYNNRLYTFSKKKYMEQFVLNPSYYEERFMDTLECNVNLVIFFGMYEEMKHFHIKKITSHVVVEQVSKTPKYNSVEIQTELHPIPEYKPHDYTWNIWDLRKKAVKLANLKKLRTHSAQTNISYHRYSLMCQTVSAKEANEQTMQTKATSLRCYNNSMMRLFELIQFKSAL